MRVATITIAIALALTLNASAQTLPFLTDAEITALASEVSGETAKRTVEGLSRHHRMRGSVGFRAATEQIVGELKRYGLEDAHIESFPADGKIFYGTQRSRPAWNGRFAELWEVDASGSRVARLASWDAAPITLAQDSESANVTAQLIDVGDGSREADYEGRDVKGKIVLASAQPGPVAALAVARFGAVGIISHAQNQRTAWYGEDENLVRWGHLETFAPEKTFGFMVSLKTARALQQRLARGESIRLHAMVDAGQEPGAYDIATATIRGSSLPEQEIIFSCHLDHPRPGANDNASGCATILEVARTLSKLIADRRIERPRRTIRFVWPAEIEGTLALLNGDPALAKRLRAAIHLDMVGGGAETKAIFHVTRGPASLPSFVHDVAQAVGELVNTQSAALAMTGSARWPMVASDGGRDPLRAAFVSLTLGSDHQVYGDSSFAIPAIYMNDWPDRYIHTNRDVPANIDSTKLGRVAFLAAASGYALARISRDDEARLRQFLKPFALERSAAAMRRGARLSASRPLSHSVEKAEVAFGVWYEKEMSASLLRFLDLAPAVSAAPRKGAWRRNPAVRGPMSAFGYDYFTAHYPQHSASRLADEVRYEALNLVNGQRTTEEIRDALSASYAPVPVADVEQYLKALESIMVVKRIEN